MAWQRYQQYRLAQDHQLLSWHLPDFTFRNPTSNTYVEGSWTSNANWTYRIRVYLHSGYPDEPPTTYITSPSPLRGYYMPIEAYGSSNAMHTYETDRPGWVKICTFHPDDWSAEYTLVKVIHKALLWLTAFEGHRIDGSNIENFLIHA